MANVKVILRTYKHPNKIRTLHSSSFTPPGLQGPCWFLGINKSKSQDHTVWIARISHVAPLRWERVPAAPTWRRHVSSRHWWLGRKVGLEIWTCLKSAVFWWLENTWTWCDFLVLVVITKKCVVLDVLVFFLVGSWGCWVMLCWARNTLGVVLGGKSVKTLVVFTFAIKRLGAFFCWCTIHAISLHHNSSPSSWTYLSPQTRQILNETVWVRLEVGRVLVPKMTFRSHVCGIGCICLLEPVLFISALM